MNSEDSAYTIFNDALEIDDPAARASYLKEACANDAALSQRVQKLLQAHGEAGQFLSSASTEVVTAPASTPTEKTGDVIGRYKLLEQIGEGGCGVVYMAEQQEPVRRRVALKVIKLGMDTKQVVARFEAERQALAMMDHPNIARVLDAGATSGGRPYFVMELVRGAKITEFCDRKKLSTQERLELFIRVCQAVQHAHQKGIIHRDLKPSNILVTLVDGAAVPKVIDFGIAKATSNQPLTDKTLFTAFEQFIGTPAYMSPEQAEMSGVDVDTRTDLYSLGVVLYELITGKTPFDAEALIRAGIDQIRRTIREQEPRRPSTRLHTLARPDLTTTAQARQTDEHKLLHSVSGDLDWIVMKCLEKDRARRYETVNGLALDIQRHLNNEPVVARPPSRWYEFQKTVRRHKVGFAAAAAVIVALVIGLGIALWQSMERTRAYKRAILAEKSAQSEAAKSRQVAQFLKEMLNSVDPSVALGRDTTLLREILDRTAQRVGNELGDQPEVEAELRSIIGNTYHELGDWPKAVAMHREALRVRKALFGETNAFVASSLADLGNVLRTQLHFSEAEGMHREALAMRRKLLGDEHPEVVHSLGSLADLLLDRGRLAEAEAALREALRIQRKLPGAEYPGVGDLLNALVSVLVSQDKLADAEHAGREAVELGRTWKRSGHPTAATSLLRLASVLEQQGKLPEAEAACREAVEMRRKLLGNEHPYVASALDRLASVLGRQGKETDATVFLAECLAIREKVMPDDPQVFTARLRLGEQLLAQKEYAKAEPLLLSAYQGMNEHKDRLAAARLPYLRRVLKAVVQLYETTGQTEKAAGWGKELAAFDSKEGDRIAPGQKP